VEVLPARLKELWFDNVRLKVNKAKFTREEKPLPATIVEEKKGGGGAGGALVTTGVSFKSVLIEDKGKAIAIEVGEYCVEVTPSEEMLNILSCAFVGELKCVEEAVSIQQQMVMEGVVGVQVTDMGDQLVLLVESEAGVVDRAAKAH